MKYDSQVPLQLTLIKITKNNNLALKQVEVEFDWNEKLSISGEENVAIFQIIKISPLLKIGLNINTLDLCNLKKIKFLKINLNSNFDKKL